MMYESIPVSAKNILSQEYTFRRIVRVPSWDFEERFDPTVMEHIFAFFGTLDGSDQN